jgi:hypothetical protein
MRSYHFRPDLIASVRALAAFQYNDLGAGKSRDQERSPASWHHSARSDLLTGVADLT